MNNRQDAEECVNDAYLGAWNAIPPTRPNPLLSDICKIVRNISLKIYYRKEAAKRSSHYTIAMEEIEACIADPNTVEAEIEARELACIIESFLDTLTVENRVIFMRRYWFSDSCKDIAEFVGLSEKNVSVRLTRIRQKMKDYEAVCDPPAQLSGNHIPALQVPPDSESHGGEAGGSGTGHFRDSSSG